MYHQLETVATVLALSLFASAQSSLNATATPASSSKSTSTSTYSQSNVPTGTPVSGNYDGPLRPQVHYSPPNGFMNDPNGMFVDENGTWHLYYQCTSYLIP